MSLSWPGLGVPAGPDFLPGRRSDRRATPVSPVSPGVPDAFTPPTPAPRVPESSPVAPPYPSPGRGRRLAPPVLAAVLAGAIAGGGTA